MRIIFNHNKGYYSFLLLWFAFKTLADTLKIYAKVGLLEILEYYSANYLILNNLFFMLPFGFYLE